MSFECMEDCIHLKACRRVQAIGRKHRLMVPRYCTEDCTAYVSGDTCCYVSVGKAAHVARMQYDGPQNEYDAYTETDFGGQTLGEIVNEFMEVEQCE